MKHINAVEALHELKTPVQYIRGTSTNKLAIPVEAKSLSTGNKYKTKTLVDCGCEGSVIDREFIEKQGIQTKKLKLPIPVYNADGTANSSGSISEHVALEIDINSHIETIDFGVMNLDSHNIYLGYDWLKFHNPLIDWREGLVEFS